MVQDIQYGYKFIGVNQTVRLENQGKSVISFQLVVDNLQKSIHHVPEYPLSRFLSDVGGSFGLFLGISIASIGNFSKTSNHLLAFQLGTLKK